jgi:hypothetical protein
MRLPHGLTTKEQMMSTYTPNEIGSTYGRKLETDELDNVSGGEKGIGAIAAETALKPTGIGAIAAATALQPTGIGAVVMDTILHPK